MWNKILKQASLRRADYTKIQNWWNNNEPHELKLVSAV